MSTSKTFAVTITANAIIKGRMLTLRYLVKRTEKLELLLPASILVVRKSIKITVATMLIAAVKPIVAIVVTVVTVVTVVITFLLP